MTDHPDYILWLNQVGMNDIASVGGKNASLGEMIGNLARAGVKVPGGFATTTRAYREFLEIDGLGDRISQKLSGLDVGDVTALADTGKSIRSWLLAAPLPDNLLKAVAGAYQKLVSDMGEEVSFAVRSSATAEDLADASFAGQQETLLNVHGLENLISAIREVFASLYNDRAIAYRVHHGFHHDQVFLSAGVQKMVRSDRGASGVMFTLDTESGFREVVFVTSTYGLGETVVQGIVNPDEFIVYKPNLEARLPAILSRRSGTKAIEMIYSDGQTGQATEIRPVPPDRSQRFSLSDEQIESLARQAVIIERHYNRPMDIEWALDGIDGQIYIVQARPETVKSRAEQSIEQFRLDERGQVLVQGRAIGQKIGQGRARVILNAGQMSEVQPGDVLVTDMTDPDWEPIMKRAAAIVTNRGGRTCHAAIIARELGIPAVVGCEQATAKSVMAMR